MSNLQALEAVGRGSETQLQGAENVKLSRMWVNKSLFWFFLVQYFMCILLCSKSTSEITSVIYDDFI